MTQAGTLAITPKPVEVEKSALATVLDDPAYATGTHAEIADAINAATVDVPRTIITLDEIYNLLDPAETAAMDTGRAVGFWRLLEQGQFDVTGKPFALFSALCPTNSLKALQAYVATPKTVPLAETLGFSRPLDYGDVSAVKGFEPDILDIETNELQNASGLSRADRDALDTKNADSISSIEASPVLVKAVS